MKNETLAIGIALAAAALVVASYYRKSARRGVSPSLATSIQRYENAGGTLWPDTEAAYQGTWTANGPLDLSTYNKQIYD